MSLNPHVLEFIIDKANARYDKFGKDFRNDCTESIDIFDELDSLVESELQSVTAVFLLGSEKSSNNIQAMCEAQKIGFKAVEIITHDSDLHHVLSNGYKLWSKT